LLFKDGTQILADRGIVVHYENPNQQDPTFPCETVRPQAQQLFNSRLSEP
jgi:hypothetical protein